VKRRRTLLSWSSGKDSAYSLATLRNDPGFEVVGLLTTVNAVANRVAMHAVRDELLQAQADAVGLPLQRIAIPSPCSNAEYEQAMGRGVEDAVEQGITHLAFGDLFLEDIRAYREAQLLRTGITPVFPLWGRETRRLAQDMLDAGIRAILTCVDPNQIPPRFAGRTYDSSLLAELPKSCDPCGENGEFHTFVWDGPGFTSPVPVAAGEIVQRDGFAFADLAHRPDVILDGDLSLTPIS
jgi:uncharacterized protein (TIGR00290 family)